MTMSREDRVEYLKTLSDGWLDGAGKAPTKEALATAMTILDARLYPTEEGGISMEFDLDGLQVIWIEPSGRATFSCDYPHAASAD